MSVRAWLTGHPTDLETIARHFDSGDPAIGQDENGEYYLTSQSLDALWDKAGEMRERALWLLTQINGLACALDSGFRPVALVSRFSDEQGRLHQVVAADSAVGRATVGMPVITVNGEVQNPMPSPAPSYLQQGAHDPDVAEALAIMGRAGETIGWSDLYKVFEIIRESIGGHQALVNLGWKSKKDISAFTVSANSPTVSGEAARHARLNSGTPQHTMTISAGRAMVRDLLLVWLKSRLPHE
jgi:hypothetical protein